MKVVGVRFRKSGKIYYFNPLDYELAFDDAVIVETARGIEFGCVAIAPKDLPEDEVPKPLKDIIRKATAEDIATYNDNKTKEREAFQDCKEKIVKHQLPMKLVEVNYTFDKSKLIFYFTSESRVDFRDLVKDLASSFRARIELRQIGVRDETKMKGGLGTCGRVLCCHQVLDDFHPVSIRMAKQQNLSLNPAKISGICGRLMCCLKYESYDDYAKDKKSPKLPDPDLLTDLLIEDAAILESDIIPPELGEALAEEKEEVEHIWPKIAALVLDEENPAKNKKPEELHKKEGQPLANETNISKNKNKNKHYRGRRRKASVQGQNQNQNNTKPTPPQQ